MANFFPKTCHERSLRGILYSLLPFSLSFVVTGEFSKRLEILFDATIFQGLKGIVKAEGDRRKNGRIP